MFNVEFSSKARKFLKKIDDTTWKRITQEIEKLQSDPFPSDIKRVVGRKEKTFRVRVGSHRILYVVFFDRNILFISKIDKRPRAFQK